MNGSGRRAPIDGEAVLGGQERWGEGHGRWEGYGRAAGKG